MKQPKLTLGHALDFFRTFMYAPLQAKRGIYEARGIRLGSVTPASDWEVLASMLVNHKGNGGTSGVDLVDYEVKSAINGGDYEYQYHKDTGKKKLTGDMKAGHLFFNHVDFLNRVELRYVDGRDMKKNYFSVWLKDTRTRICNGIAVAFRLVG